MHPPLSPPLLLSCFSRLSSPWSVSGCLPELLYRPTLLHHSCIRVNSLPDRHMWTPPREFRYLLRVLRLSLNKHSDNARSISSSKPRSQHLPTTREKPYPFPYKKNREVAYSRWHGEWRATDDFITPLFARSTLHTRDAKGYMNSLDIFRTQLWHAAAAHFLPASVNSILKISSQKFSLYSNLKIINPRRNFDRRNQQVSRAAPTPGHPLRVADKLARSLSWVRLPPFAE